MEDSCKETEEKSDIIAITGHNNEAGLDGYNSGDEIEQR